MTTVEVGEPQLAKKIFETVLVSDLNVDGRSFTKDDVYTFLGEIIDQLNAQTDGDWIHIDLYRGLSTPWEVNREGLIRNRKTREVIDPEFDIDYNKYLVKVELNGEFWWLNGPGLAEIKFNNAEPGAYPINSMVKESDVFKILEKGED